MNLFFFLTGVVSCLIVLLIINTIITSRDVSRLRRVTSNIDTSMYREVDSLRQSLHEYDVEASSRSNNLERDMSSKVDDLERYMLSRVDDLLKEISLLSEKVNKIS